MPTTTSGLAVTIKINELKFAVMNKTHVTARSLQAIGKLNYEAAAHMQVSEDPENSYELIRAINDAIAETKVELGEYLNAVTTSTSNRISGSVEGVNANGSANSDPEVVLNFDMPSNFNSAAADALGAGIHEFVVGRTIYAWYRQTFPDIAEACRVDADAALEKAKKALYKRSRPTRPTYGA